MTDDLNPRAVIGHNMPPLAEILAEATRETDLEILELVERATVAPKPIKSPEEDVIVATIIVDEGELWNRVDTLRKQIKRPYFEACKQIDAWFGEGRLLRLEKMGKILTPRVSEWKQRLYDQEQAELKSARLKAAAEELRQAEIARNAEERGRLKLAERAKAAADNAADRAERLAAATVKLDHAKTEEGVTSTARFEYEILVGDYSAIDMQALAPFISPAHIDAAIKAYVKVNKDQKPLGGVVITKKVVARIRA